MELNKRIHKHGVDKLKYLQMPTNDFKLKELEYKCMVCLNNLNTETALNIESKDDIIANYKGLELV